MANLPSLSNFTPPNGFHICRLWLLRGAIIGSVLLASLAIPQVLPPRLTIYFARLLLVSGVVLALLHQPALGPVLLILVSLVVPSPYFPGGLNVAVLFMAMLACLWLLQMLVRLGQTKFVRSQPVKPLLAFVLVVILAFIVGQLRWFPTVSSAPLDAQLGAVAIFVLSAAAFLLVANQVRDLRWLQAMTWAFLSVGALHVGSWLVPSLLGPLGGRLQLGATSNSMFWVWMAALSFSQALYNRKLHPGWRIALGLLVVGILYKSVVLNDDWKSGYMPVIVALFAIIGVRFGRAGLLLALLVVWPANYLASSAIATDEYSYATRMEAWGIVLGMLKVNPFFGFGPANYYWYTPLFLIRGWSVNFSSHNQYVDILAQTGIVGLICFLWFVLVLGWLGWSLKDRAPEGFARAYVYGALGGLAGMLVSGMLADWFLPFTYNIGLTGFRGSVLAWLFLGGLVSIEQMIRHGEGLPSN